MPISREEHIEDFFRKQALEKKAIRARGLKLLTDRHSKNGKTADEVARSLQGEAVQIGRLLEATGRKDWHERYIAFMESGASLPDVTAWIETQAKLKTSMAEIEAEKVPASQTPPTSPTNAPLYSFTMVGTNHAAEIDAARSRAPKNR